MPVLRRNRTSSRECPAVREESQIEDMRSAIRGDFERLAERRGDQKLMVAAEDSDKPQPEEPEPAPTGEASGKPRRSWLSRLVSP